MAAILMIYFGANLLLHAPVSLIHLTSPNPSEPRWFLEWDFWVSVFTLIHSKQFGTVEELKHWELRARYDFEEMMNFYNLVNHRIKNTVFQDRDEFYYDWWRPFFWWVSDEINCYYKEMPEQRRRLVSLPKWQAIWESLDQIYVFETANTPNDRWIEFQVHPIVASLGLDENRRSPAASA